MSFPRRDPRSGPGRTASDGPRGIWPGVRRWIGALWQRALQEASRVRSSREEWRSVRRLAGAIRPYWGRLVLAFVAMLLSTGLMLVLPILFGEKLIDQVLLQDKNLATLNLLLVLALFLLLLRDTFSYFERYLASFVGQRVQADLRARLFDKLLDLSLSFHERQHSGELLSRLTNDVYLVYSGINTDLMQLLEAVVVAAGTLAFIFILNWRLALLGLLVIPVGTYAVGRFGQEARGLARGVQEQVARLTGLLEQTLGAIRVVKVSQAEEQERERFAWHNEAAFQASMRSEQLAALMNPAMDFLAALVMSVVVWYGGVQVVRGNLTTGQLLAFFAYLGYLGGTVASVGRYLPGLARALAASDRIFAVLAETPTVTDRPGAQPLPPVRGEIRFCHVRFSYTPGQPVLEDVNLEVKPGQVVALVGPSGAGKTSLANLVLRLYDPDEGQVLVDGHDLRQVQIASLRRQVGVVPQETVLFAMSVRENVTYGCPQATDAQVEAALRAANAWDFVSQLPQGWDTVLSDRGQTLSGGQRQRLAIARALLRNPRILILDEATSSLDTESERLVQEALERLLAGRTTLIIAHRLSTIQRAHVIVVLDHGRVVQQGTHAALLAEEGPYRRLYEAQWGSPAEQGEAEP
ncbi:MAG: ABC transporter ATP-binding protein [Firmicutes bacterium]|nr:ABC transporter ATP-binding protein [Bacillota bacterium]